MRSRNICGGRWMGNWVRLFLWPFLPPGVHPVASPHYAQLPIRRMGRGSSWQRTTVSLSLCSRTLSFNYHFIPCGTTHALPQVNQTESLWSIGRFLPPSVTHLASPRHRTFPLIILPLGLMVANWDLCLPPCDPVRSSSIWETMSPSG